MMKISGSPIVPRNKADPTQSYRAVNKMAREIERRYTIIKQRLRILLDARLVGVESQANHRQSSLVCNNQDIPDSIFFVNAGTYIYSLHPTELANLMDFITTILDDELLQGGRDNLWAMDYISTEYERGAQVAYTNLANQSQVYAENVTLMQILSSPGHLNQIQMARVPVYADWRLLSQRATSDLTNIIASAITEGINPRETKSIISKRLDVSMSDAKRIAQTEQLGALRKAQWSEATYAKEELGLNAALMHVSALSPTTRITHANRHGHIYTEAEVAEWYSVNGNQFNCKCSQIPVLLNQDGQLVNKGLVERMKEERSHWVLAKR
ncbi:MAG: hypothetical protein [Bacteriophage sp.]|nr:MAG: hypothetical protein [Bacteriophage sp.]